MNRQLGSALLHVAAVEMQGAAYGAATKRKAAAVVPALLRAIAADMAEDESHDVRLYAEDLRELADRLAKRGDLRG